MSPTELIIAAITAGIAAGLRGTVEQSVRDFYQQLKSLLQDRYDVDVSQLERYPDSTTQRAGVIEQLDNSSATKDKEVLSVAQNLLDAIKVADKNIVTSGPVNAPSTTISGTGNTVDNTQTNVSSSHTNIDNSRTENKQIYRNPIIAVLGIVVLLAFLWFLFRGLSGGGGLPATPAYMGVFLIDGNEYVETLSTRGAPELKSSFPVINDKQPEIALWKPDIDYSLLMLQPLSEASASLNNPANIPFRLGVTEDDLVIAQVAVDLSSDIYCFVQGDWMGIPGQLNHYCFEVR